MIATLSKQAVMRRLFGADIADIRLSAASVVGDSTVSSFLENLQSSQF